MLSKVSDFFELCDSLIVTKSSHAMIDWIEKLDKMLKNLNF